jgi:hypothetical protein
MHPQGSGLVPLFVVLNFCFATLGLLGFLFFGGILIFGVFFSGDEGEDVVAGVIGCLFFMMIFIVVSLLYTIAAIGLLRRAVWGYYFHLVGAALAALSCLGMAYTIPAIICALRADFQSDFFPSYRQDPLPGSEDF